LEIQGANFFLPRKLLDQQKRNTEELNTTVKYRFVHNFIAKDVFLTVALFLYK